MQPARYLVRLMFEWGGGCLWSGDDATRSRFDVGPIESRLPLAADTRRRLDELTRWHDQSLDWADPRDPSTWSADECTRFDQAAEELRAVVQAELGAEFDVVYEPL